MPTAPPPHYHPTPHPDSGWYNQGKNHGVKLFICDLCTSVSFSPTHPHSPPK